MKIFIRLTFILIATTLLACSGTNKDEANAENNTEVEVNQELEGMQELDLREFQLDAQISIPDESKGKSEVYTTDWGSIVVEIGSSFGLEIVPFGMPISDKKTELASDLVYDVEYLDENANLIFYKKTIKGSDIKPEFHFFMTTNIDGDVVEVRSLSEHTYTKAQVEKMLVSATSLTSAKPV